MRLTIQGLTKTYPGGVRALGDVNLDIGPGLFGLLGPNGAGKSTLMRTLATLQEADAGRVYLDDIDVLRDKKAVRHLLGYLPQEFGVYPKVSAFELLDHLAGLKGIGPQHRRWQEVTALLKRTNLFEVRHRKLGTFSGGMKQRFGIAQALLGNPKLVIVDEPTAGLDPEERERFHNLLADIGEDVIVILSTHIVADVADLCPTMAVIHQGQVVATGDPQQVAAGLKGRLWRKTLSREELAVYERTQAEKWPILRSRRLAGRVVVHVEGDGPPDASFERVTADLEDVYFSVIRGANGPRAAGAGPLAAATSSPPPA